MNMFIRSTLAVLLCVAVAAGAVVLAFRVMDSKGGPVARGARADVVATPAPGRPGPKAEDGGGFDPGEFEDGGFGVAGKFTGAVDDPTSLAQLRAAILARGTRGVRELEAKAAAIRVGPGAPRDEVIAAGMTLHRLGLIYLYEGRFDDASAAFRRVLEIGKGAGLPSPVRSRMVALLGITALRKGEIDNCLACLGPSSCIFPIDPAAMHTHQEGSREAIRWFTTYLNEWPDDLRVRWLLNIACMTVGEYPDGVPAKYRIPLDTYQSRLDIGRFDNLAARIGLTARGPNLAGGSVFDDLDGDGRPDLFTTSLDGDLGASLYLNNGDGTFADATKAARVADQVYALNVRHADIDNDGDLDLLLLRGAWEKPMRLSLLRNDGRGHFEDITLAAGLGVPIASEAAAFGDFDDDGLIDLYVCGEYLPPSGDLNGAEPDPRNRGRLYRNKGDGTFEDVAEKAGVFNERCGKGAAWGDYDDDGKLDLFVSNMNGASRLYRNLGDGRFADVAPVLGVTGADASFACWFWDYDNDGKLDIYVNENRVTLAETAAAALALPVSDPSRPRLYRNLGREGFRDVTAEVGLDRPMAPMGVNFGDVDNDGYLDLYLGTGWMSYSGLVPNLLFKNVDGQRFADITLSSGTGHLQKGHGVSFADYDGDGDLDLFVELGGAVPGDKGYNALFRNPGHKRHWLKVKLVGTKTNRAALGARIKAVVADPDGKSRTIYRTVGNNSSFGGNCLVESLGLGAADRVATLQVTWPVSRTTQTFRDLAVDRALQINEGDDVPVDLHAGPRHGLGN
jgi:hypothetical protein